MKHLGKYLLENGIVSVEQLEEALQSQVAFGGRLGTNLVELGHLSLEDLERHLAQHTGIPAPPREWLETPQIEALQAVSLELVKRHKVLPLQLEREKRTLHVGLIDPLDPRKIDELGFATGFRIKPYMLPEATAYHWLDYHYDIPREIRHIDVRGREVCDPEEEAWQRRQRAPEPVAVAAEAQALGIKPLDAGEELVGETTFAELQTRMIRRMDAVRNANQARTTPLPPAPAAPAPTPEPSRAPVEPAPPPPPPKATTPEPVTPQAAAPEDETAPTLAPDAMPTRPLEPASLPSTAARIARLEDALSRTERRSAVVSAALDLAAELACGTALFLVRSQTIEGMDARGDDLSARIRSVVLPREGRSRFAETASSREPLHLTAPTDGIDARILGALGRGRAHDFALIPVEIRGRVVNLLYADNGPDPLGPVTFAALRALSTEMSAAYERLILVRKRKIG